MVKSRRQLWSWFWFEVIILRFALSSGGDSSDCGIKGRGILVVRRLGIMVVLRDVFLTVIVTISSN